MGLDENDPIDRLILQELRGEPVTFVEWEYMWHDLEKEPNDAEVLQEHGYTAERGQKEGAVFREEFLQLLQKHGLPLSDRMRLFYHLAEQAIDAPSDELLYLYCAILADTGFLLDQSRDPYQGEGGARHYLVTMTHTVDLFCELKGRIRMSKTLRRIFFQKFKSRPLPANGETNRKYEIFQIYSNACGTHGNETVFLNSIDDLLQMLAAYPELRMIEPLFLYQVLTRHGKRLYNGALLHMNFKALWKYQKYRIDRDNGKNFKANLAHLTLFSSLCELYRHEEAVDLLLCCHGFEMLSNLGEFYRLYMLEDIPIDLPEPIEDIVIWGPPCYEGGGRNAILESDESLDEIVLERFRCDPKYERPLEHIARYLNQDMERFAECFWGADDMTVKQLCNQILTGSKLPTRWQPKSVEELSLFLAAINEGLLTAMDEYTSDILTQAGQAFLDTL